MIPKIIHYCWFGRNPKPKLAEKCIKSWKKYCRDYQIIEWNEDNFDIQAAPLYVRQAYEAKKWAFVTDYVRLWAMVKFGGVYMDTDVEVIKPIDKFLEHDAVSGFESEKQIPTGFMACREGFRLFKELLCEYDSISFCNDDGTYDTTTNVVRITNYCLQNGFIPNGKYQVIDGFALYPKEYFCPIDCETMIMSKTRNTYTIHWFSGSWLSEEYKERKKKEQIRSIRDKRKNKKHYILHLPNRVLRGILGDEKYEKLKNKKY